MLRRAAAAKKRDCVALLLCATTAASDRGRVGETPTAAVGATGLDRRHTSRYFAARSGRPHAAWTELAVAADTATHFLAGATVTVGPANDSPPFTPVMAQAALAIDGDRVPADAAFDSEAHHAYARGALGVRSSVIPINPRNAAGPPGGRYRSPVPARFRPRAAGSRHRRVYGQRWQAGSAFRRHKRRLGTARGASPSRPASGNATCGC